MLQAPAVAYTAPICRTKELAGRLNSGNKRYPTRSNIAGVTARCTPGSRPYIARIKKDVSRNMQPTPRSFMRTPPVLLQVSGSALGMEGQVSVFNFRGGPCYRCVFPAPLEAEAGRRCSDNGVLGTVPGEGGQVARYRNTLPRTALRFVSCFVSLRFVSHGTSVVLFFVSD